MTSAHPIYKVGLAALCALALAASAHGAAPQVKTQAPGFYRMTLGDFEVTALFDGVLEFKPKVASFHFGLIARHCSAMTESWATATRSTPRPNIATMDVEARSTSTTMHVLPLTSPTVLGRKATSQTGISSPACRSKLPA